MRSIMRSSRFTMETRVATSHVNTSAIRSVVTRGAKSTGSRLVFCYGTSRNAIVIPS